MFADCIFFVHLFILCILLLLSSFFRCRYYHLPILSSSSLSPTDNYVGDVRDAFDESAGWWGKCDAVEGEGRWGEGCVQGE